MSQHICIRLCCYYYYLVFKCESLQHYLKLAYQFYWPLPVSNLSAPEENLNGDSCLRLSSEAMPVNLKHISVGNIIYILRLLIHHPQSISFYQIKLHPIRKEKGLEGWFGAETNK